MILTKAFPNVDTFWGPISKNYANGAFGRISITQTPDRALSGTGLDWKGGDVWQRWEREPISTSLTKGKVTGIDYNVAPSNRYPLNLLLGNEF